MTGLVLLLGIICMVQALNIEGYFSIFGKKYCEVICLGKKINLQEVNGKDRALCDKVILLVLNRRAFKEGLIDEVTKRLIDSQIENSA
ncbi:MAG: hypothetical protein FWB74_09275 [Defluviitaleaceae bacterium]|nr:hypothetical protein [Defluviitaleaceae bacterium]